MLCPHCQIAIHEGSSRVGALEARRYENYYVDWAILHQICPECKKDIFWLSGRRLSEGVRTKSVDSEFKELIWPKKIIKSPPSGRVERVYASDYIEACLVLNESSKASAALSRRCLQHLLRDKVGVKHGTLDNEIQQVIDGKLLPSYLVESLDAVRVIGNFAAHPIKSTSSGEIIDVEPGEAEWTIDVVEALFDHLFDQPAEIKKKREDLNKKLADAGKPSLK